MKSALDEDSRRQRVAAVGTAFTSADQQTLNSWRAEPDLWEAMK
jgi:hypothetical protein